MNKEELKDEFELDIEFEVDKNNRVDMNQVIELVIAYNKLFRTYKQLKTQIDELNKQLENTINSYTEEHNMRHNSDLELDILKTQQKEFMNFLTEAINKLKLKQKTSNSAILKANTDLQMEVYSIVLSKYKSIIGVSNEKKYR